MSMASLPLQLLQALGQFNPAPLFGLSLIPYLVFLWCARRLRSFPPLARWGFNFTLVFVTGTVVASVIASIRQGAHLADVDHLHGGAEALLSISNVLVLLGFQRAITRLEANRQG